MGLKIKEIIKIPITTNTKEEILEYIYKYLSTSSYQRLESRKKIIKPFIIFTPNPEIIAYAQNDKYFRKIVRSAQINLPDGAGVVWALKKRYNEKVKRIAGADFIHDLCELASKKRFTIGLIGGRGVVAVEALECLQQRNKNLKGWAISGPEIQSASWRTKSKIQNYNSNSKSYFLSLANKIVKSKTSIVFVGLGFPKQEWFIQHIKNQISKIKYQRPLVLMAVGGTFDYLSGRTPRAPQWMSDRGYEWLFRLVTEPHRLKRQLLGARFFLDVLRARS